jgi:putative endonuclease
VGGSRSQQKTSARRSARPDLGRRAEALAAAQLEGAGLRIVARNWRVTGREGGELDIVADDQGTCVFVEVRSRSGEERGHPLEAITAHKRAHIIRAARLFLAAEQPQAAGYRFDVVAVTFWPGLRGPDVIHISNAFEVGSGASRGSD